MIQFLQKKGQEIQDKLILSNQNKPDYISTSSEDEPIDDKKTIVAITNSKFPRKSFI